MIKEILDMTQTQQQRVQHQIGRFAQLRSFGNYVYWFRFFCLIAALVLFGYSWSWGIEAPVGVHAWLNNEVYERSTLVLSTYGYFGALVLAHYAFTPNIVPLPVYFLCTAPLTFYGLVSVLSPVPVVANVAHISVATLVMLSVVFYTATLREFSRNQLENQELQRDKLQLEAHNLELEGKLIAFQQKNDDEGVTNAS